MLDARPPCPLSCSALSKGNQVKSTKRRGRLILSCPGGFLPSVVSPMIQGKGLAFFLTHSLLEYVERVRFGMVGGVYAS